MPITKEQLQDMRTHLLSAQNAELHGRGFPWMSFFDDVLELCEEVERLQDALEQKKLELIMAQASNDQLRVVMEAEQLTTVRLQKELDQLRACLRGEHEDHCEHRIVDI